MSYLKKLTLLIVLVTSSIAPLQAKDDYRIEEQTVALEIADQLQGTGTLRIKDNGFVYLDVDNAFVDAVVAELDIPGLMRKRPTAKKSMGAHVSVFHEKEAITPDELGQDFGFTVQDIRSFTVHTRDGLKHLWALAVNSPELEALRSSYGLKPLLQGYSFHITLGKQMPAAPEGWDLREDFLTIPGFDEQVIGLADIGDFTVVKIPSVMKTARRVDAIGQITLKSNGFVYANVDNAYITQLVDQLPLTGSFKPVSTKSKSMGAHISVLHEDETIKRKIWELAEAGSWVDFEVKELRFFERKGKDGAVRRVWLLAVDAPMLQKLRMSYSLKPKLKNYDFHITLGTETVCAVAAAA